MADEVKRELLGVTIAAVEFQQGAIFDGNASFLVWIAAFALVERASSYDDLYLVVVLRRIVGFVEDVLVDSVLAIDDLVAIAWLQIVVDDCSHRALRLILALFSSLSK